MYCYNVTPIGEIVFKNSAIFNIGVAKQALASLPLCLEFSKGLFSKQIEAKKCY